MAEKQCNFYVKTTLSLDMRFEFRNFEYEH
jgi:hypothetical protein